MARVGPQRHSKKKKMLKEILESWRSVFSVAIRLYGLDGPGFESRQGKVFFFSTTS